MPESYGLFALVITVLLLPAYAQLYRRLRDVRSLLWFLGFLFVVLRMLQNYRLGLWDISQTAAHPWWVAAGQSFILVGTVLLLSSFAPVGFRVGRVRILYAIPFAIPLVAYAILLYGVYGGVTPRGLPFLILPSLGALALLAGCLWAYSVRNMRSWISLGLSIVLGGAALRIFVNFGGEPALNFIEYSARILTVLLILNAYRRLSLGTVLAGLGFLVWSFHLTSFYTVFLDTPSLDRAVPFVVSIGTVIAAVGILVIALEEEVTRRNLTQEREIRAHGELEAYSRLYLTSRRVEDFDRQAQAICKTITEQSRFTQAALLLPQGPGHFRLAGAEGFEDAVVNVLEAVSLRISASQFLSGESVRPVVQNAHAFSLSLESWLHPGDKPKRLRIASIVAVPLRGHSSIDGAILLNAPRNPAEPYHSQDFLALELLAARIQSAREQTLMLEKLVDSEKFASLGQLAGSVTRQLNNPITVILGYSSLIEQSEGLDPQLRKAVDAILGEAHAMRATIDSLSRMSSSPSGPLADISVNELLDDMEKLHRNEFLHRSINLRINAPPTLPHVLGNAQQVRQAVLYCLQFAIDSVETLDPNKEKTVRIDATLEDRHVRITIAHTGPGFLHPSRAFDPFARAQAAGEAASLGLSLCATILRENSGRISAVNYEPRGAAILLDLQVA